MREAGAQISEPSRGYEDTQERKKSRQDRPREERPLKDRNRAVGEPQIQGCTKLPTLWPTCYDSTSRFGMRALLRWLFVLTMSVGLFMLVAPGCRRSTLQPEDLDASFTSSTSSTSGNPSVCGPSTCSNGCC